MPEIDHLIVGAGTAGCVLAARLSEDPDRQVVVVEAGPDFADLAALPPELLTGAGEGYDAGLVATLADERTGSVPRGRLVGGSAQVNGCGAVRAPAADFDAWAASGALPAWSWSEVLPAYRRLETDQDFGAAPYHGSRGPVPIRRPALDQLVPAVAAFLDAALATGVPFVEDMNRPDAFGIGPYPMNRRDSVRMSTNLTHLMPARQRPNLRVRGETPVERVLVRDGRAIGVETADERLLAREVILCAGTPMSPVLLLRSGIGPSEELAAVGVSTTLDLPGVGHGLRDQPGAVIAGIPSDGTAETTVTSQVLGRLDALPDEPARGGFYLNLFAGPDPFEGTPVSAVMVGDLTPASRGRITIAGPDPRRPPDVDLGFYATPEGLTRMRAAFRQGWSVARQPAFRRTLSGFVGVDESLVADDGRLNALLREQSFSRSALHGGACMGPASARDAVVDERCRVHGVAGLRVVDLSIAPVALRSPTAVDAMMIGERAAELLG